MAEGGLSRRRLMGIAAGTGLAAWTAPYRLAGAQAPSGESPKYGGVLTQDTFADPPHFDLHQSETITALLPLAPCYSRLIQPDPFDVDKLIPDLAERWDISKDGKVYTFQLRRGV
jgi:ABC-type transport system substrate-binding protein